MYILHMRYGGKFDMVTCPNGDKKLFTREQVIRFLRGKNWRLAL